MCKSGLIFLSLFFVCIGWAQQKPQTQTEIVRPVTSVTVTHPQTKAVVAHPKTGSVATTHPPTTVVVQYPVTMQAVSHPQTQAEVVPPVTTVAVVHPQTTVEVVHPTTTVLVTHPGMSEWGENSVTAGKGNKSAATSMSGFQPKQAKDLKAGSKRAAPVGGGTLKLGNETDEASKDSAAKSSSMRSEQSKPMTVDPTRQTANLGSLDKHVSQAARQADKHK